MRTYSISSHRNKIINIDLELCNSNNKPIVIFSHGFKGFKDWGPFNYISKKFAQSGLNFLKFNYSHNGVNIKNPYEFSDLEAFGNNNFSIELEDLESVISWVIDKLDSEVDIDQIFLLGHSRGGGLSFLKASTNKYVKKVVSWASVSDFGKRIENDKLELWKERGVVYVFNSRTNQQMPLYYQFYEDYIENKSNFSIPDACRSLGIPALVVHGTKDETVSFCEAEDLMKYLKNATLLKIKDANHVFDASHPFDSNFCPNSLKLAIDESISFFKK